jgi:hypothetical protein
VAAFFKQTFIGRFSFPARTPIRFIFGEIFRVFVAIRDGDGCNHVLKQ